jgi:hypothetical protein
MGSKTRQGKARWDEARWGETRRDETRQDVAIAAASSKSMFPYLLVKPLEE